MTATTTNDPRDVTFGPGQTCDICGHFAARHFTAPGEPGCTFFRDKPWKFGNDTFPEGQCRCPGWPLDESIIESAQRSLIAPRDA